VRGVRWATRIETCQHRAYSKAGCRRLIRPLQVTLETRFLLYQRLCSDCLTLACVVINIAFILKRFVSMVAG
jgi:hypothetical protein